MSGAHLRLVKPVSRRKASAAKSNRERRKEFLAGRAYDDTKATIDLLLPIRRDLFTTSKAGWSVVCHIIRRLEHDAYAYVTGTTTDEVSDRNPGEGVF